MCLIYNSLHLGHDTATYTPCTKKEGHWDECMNGLKLTAH